MGSQKVRNQNARTLLIITIILAVSFFIFKLPTQNTELVKNENKQVVSKAQSEAGSRAPASIPQAQTVEIEHPPLALEKPADSDVEFIPDVQTRDYYKNNIHKQEFYDQVVQQLYKDYESNLEKNKDTVSFVLAQNVFLFDHSLGLDHPQRIDYLKATEKMLQDKELLSKCLAANEITTDYYRNQLHFIVNDYQARCSEIFDDQDYKKLFQLSKSDRFSENLGF